MLVVWKAVQVSRMHVITSQRPLQDMSWIGLLEQPDCSVEFYSESDSPVLRLILVDQPGQSFGALLPAQSQGEEYRRVSCNHKINRGVQKLASWFFS